MLFYHSNETWINATVHKTLTDTDTETLSLSLSISLFCFTYAHMRVHTHTHIRTRRSPMNRWTKLQVSRSRRHKHFPSKHSLCSWALTSLSNTTSLDTERNHHTHVTPHTSRSFGQYQRSRNSKKTPIFLTKPGMSWRDTVNSPEPKLTTVTSHMNQTLLLYNTVSVKSGILYDSSSKTVMFLSMTYVLQRWSVHSLQPAQQYHWIFPFEQSRRQFEWHWDCPPTTESSYHRGANNNPREVKIAQWSLSHWDCVTIWVMLRLCNNHQSWHLNEDDNNQSTRLRLCNNLSNSKVV